MLQCTDDAKDQLAEIERLQLRLQETEEVLEAIRSGAVDAVVVTGPDGDQIYTLTGANRAYRTLFETMNEGAAILGLDGTVLFCNIKLSAMLKTPMETIVGGSILRYVAAEDAPYIGTMLEEGLEEPQKKELALTSLNGDVVPCQISTSPFSVEDSATICMIVTDLTEHKQAEEALRQSERRFRAIFEGAEDYMWLIA